MFNNLIESSSHAPEFKRRGSFVLLTTASYLVLFAVAGVISIHAYDANLETQNTEFEITFVPLPPPSEPAPVVPRNTIRPASPSDAPVVRSTRTELFDSVSNPTNAPAEVSSAAQPVPPARWDSEVGGFNADPPVPAGGNNRGTPGGTGTAPVVNIPDTPPPPPVRAPDPPKIVKVSTGVLKGNARSLPRPVYPPIAKQIRLQGPVTVQVLIDEMGNVVSAEAVAGHPLLVPEAIKAAKQARFMPTKLSGQPVKVSGLITYNFELAN